MKRQYAYLLEILIAIAMIVLFNVIWFPSNMGFTGFMISPYWLVVIFVAARYGSFPGFVAGLAAGAALLITVSYNTALELQSEFAAIPLKQLQLAGLFVFFGFLVGEERSRVNRMLEKWKEKYNQLRNEYESLSMEHLAVKNINTELEGRILGQVETVNTVYEAAQELVTLKVENLYPAVIRLVNKFINPEKCSFYVWEEGRFVIKGHHGWGQINGRETLNVDSDILKKAMKEKRVVTVLDVYKDGKMTWDRKKDPSMVAPLFYGDNVDSASGLILVDEISFMKFNPDSVRFLSSLADWISKSFDNAIMANPINLIGAYNRELQVFNYSYALRRLKEELFQAKVSGRPSSVMLVQIANFGGKTEAEKKSTLKDTAGLLKKVLRSADLLAQFFQEDTFLAILPGSDLEGAKIAARRVQEQAKNLSSAIQVSVRPVDPAYQDESQIFGYREPILN